MKVLSLFDGISCARVAMDRSGIFCEEYHAIEFDKYPRIISDANFPDIIRPFHDVREYKGEVGYFDLLIGGSPCQDLSIAKNNRKGLEGERSGLFYEYLRILKETRPKYFILENVASMPKEAKETITKELSAVYSETECHMINAALVSGQQRKRYFWTNIPGVKQPGDRGIYLRDILENGESIEKSYCIPSTYYKENAKSLEKRKKRGLMVFTKNGLEQIKSNTIRSSGRGSGIGDKHNWDTIRIGHLNKGGQGDRIYSQEGKSFALSSNGGGRGAKTGLYAVPVALRNRGDGKKPEYNGTDKANSLTTVNTDSMVEEDFIIRKLSPIECERLQGLPDDFTNHVSNTQRYRALGNAFNVDVVAHILSFIPKICHPKN